MPAKITITHVGLSNVPSTNQTCSFYYKLQSEPEINFQLVNNNVAVQPNGDLVTPLVISGLDFDTIYTVRCVNNCSGNFVDEDFDTSGIVTTSTTTAAPTTSTTTAAPTTSTTTAAAFSDLHIEKAGHSNDYIKVIVTDEGGSGSNIYERLSGEGSHTFTGVLDNSLLYWIQIEIIPFGRPNAPFMITDGVGSIVASSGGATNGEAHNVSAAPGGIYVEVGL